LQTIDQVIELCKKEQDNFVAVTEAAHKFETKGIFNSELLFFYSLIKKYGIEHIIESGRARGQSTEIIARLTEKDGIVFDSIEFDKNSPDVLIAEERLKSFKQLKLHYGDSFEIMPKLIGSKKTAILIDGPKGVQAQKLGAMMLNHENVLLVFHHDVHRDATDVRGHMEQIYQKNILFTDDEKFVKEFSCVDSQCWIEQAKYEITSDWGPYKRGSKTMKSYSATLSVIFNNSELAKNSGRIANYFQKLIKRKNSIPSKIVRKLKSFLSRLMSK